MSGLVLNILISVSPERERNKRTKEVKKKDKKERKGKKEKERKKRKERKGKKEKERKKRKERGCSSAVPTLFCCSAVPLRPPRPLRFRCCSSLRPLW
jgi:Flp pilus assembly protein TadB